VKKEVFFRDPAQVAHRLRQLRGMRASFKMRQTNYTTVIEFPAGFKEQYIYTRRSLDVFKAHRIIGKEAIPNYVEADFEGHCRYFSIDAEKVMDLRLNPEPVYNFDLRTAYPTVLRNYGLIGDKTFKYLMRLGKVDRLASIGMFASRRTVFSVFEGELVNLEEVESEYKNIFFLPAYVTDEIMGACRALLGGDFLYYWFDGIYYTGRTRGRELSAFVRDNYHMDFKIKRLDSFLLVDRGAVVDISFMEPGRGKKRFSLPKRSAISEGRRLIESVFD